MKAISALFLLIIPIGAAAHLGDSVFLLESSDSTNAGQRVRVLRGSEAVELLGQVEP